MSVNQYLPASYAETVWRLAAGIDPACALGGAAPLPGVQLALERVPRPHPVPAGAGAIGNYEVGIGLPAVRRNGTGRFAITYSVRGLTSPLAVRLYDTGRRYVPRRFRLPVPGQAAVVAAEQAAESAPWPPIPSRVFRPVLYPGANRGPQAGATIVRGRVLRGDGSIARWARVSAVDADHGYPLGWAHGDDRGEFYLVAGVERRRAVHPRLGAGARHAHDLGPPGPGRHRQPGRVAGGPALGPRTRGPPGARLGRHGVRRPHAPAGLQQGGHRHAQLRERHRFPSAPAVRHPLAAVPVRSPMPEYLAPGVYVEEVSYRASTIEGVPTSTTGFAGLAPFGPVYYPGGPSTCQPLLVTSFPEFELAYGKLDQIFVGGEWRLPYLAHAVRAFFLNGGQILYISRVFKPKPGDTSLGVAFATFQVPTPTPSTATWRARWPGSMGNVAITTTVTRSRDVGVHAAGGQPFANTAKTGTIVEVVPAPARCPRRRPRSTRTRSGSSQ